jgi:hypothetical protein
MVMTGVDDFVQDPTRGWSMAEPLRLQIQMAGVRVVHCKREPFDVYIGRPSMWGNPYPVPKFYDREADPDRILARYEAHVRSRPELMAALPELRGKVLGCWCAPKPCHGDVLLRMANA